MEKVLIVDQDPLCRENTTTLLKGKGFDVLTAETGTQALSLIKTIPFKLLMLDQDLADFSLDHFLKRLNDTKQEDLFVILTKNEGYDQTILTDWPCLEKPFQKELLETLLNRAKNLNVKEKESPVVFKSDIMLEKLSEAKLIAKSQASVLISGESGTGKEVFAELIHLNSSRSARPFIRVNCAAIPETLIESEFFGHEKGAFTGAHQLKLGKFELAHTGTLLLDEVTEMNLPLQAKLLRVLQELEFERVGGIKPIKINVRIISTTNRNVEEAIKDKVLREDLYYRLNVIPIHLPPLREHPEDIVPLALHFLKKTCQNNQIPEKNLSECAKKALTEYKWPGNIRELANRIERATILSSSQEILANHLSLESKPY